MKNRGITVASRLLIIHPYSVVRDGVAGWLSKLPQPSVMLAGSFSEVSEALAWLEEGDADLILIEPWQGSTDAMEAIDLLRASSDAHLLLFTAVTSSELHDRAMMRGVRGILPVESDIATVLTALQRVAKGELWLSREATGRIFDAIARGGAMNHEDPHQKRLSQLTQREREIVSVFLESGGATARRVAVQLHISEHTLRNHLTSIYGKLGVANRLELHAYAQKHGVRCVLD
ncbi:response regulator transcription factor [Halomonas sp. M5N1S17]|uniref:response regulator transcription factor n=1 Tax=Halomonas alkalisoli TaxID=2907158 RepID=UPI001F2BFA3C|nr:response regulator transcription factor [Halomonas alkalisoli]MCE9662000.1 response regulator transcription factor [Halomonas alkalisoli]